MKKWARLREQVPELAPFTDDELAGYLAAAQRKLASGSAAYWATRLLTGLFVLVGIGVVLAPTMWLWGWALLKLYDNYGEWTVVGVISAFALAVFGVLRAVVGNGRPDAARYTDLMRRLARAGECARCRYRLAGLSPSDRRTGVVCCPECRLVNPMPRDQQPYVSN